jgi:hypothetical protein
VRGKPGPINQASIAAAITAQFSHLQKNAARLQQSQLTAGRKLLT